jgi:hypothetical protein
MDELKLRDIVDIDTPYGKISVIVSTVPYGGVYETAWFSIGQIPVVFRVYKLTDNVSKALENHKHVLKAFKEGLININVSEVSIQLIEESTGD